MQDYGLIFLSPKEATEQNVVDESTVSLFRRDLIEALSALATVGSSERLGYATFGSEERVWCLLQSAAVICR